MRREAGREMGERGRKRRRRRGERRKLRGIKLKFQRREEFRERNDMRKKIFCLN